MNKSLGRKVRYGLIILIILISVYIIILSSGAFVTIDQPLSIALLGLAVAIFSMGIMGLLDIQNEKKMDEMINKLDNIQKKDEDISPLAEGLISIIKSIDCLTKPK